MGFFLDRARGAGPHPCRRMIRRATSAISFQWSRSLRTALSAFSSRSTRLSSFRTCAGAFSSRIRLGPGAFAANALSPASRTARIHR